MVDQTIPFGLRLPSQRDLAGPQLDQGERRSPPLALDIAGHIDVCGPEVVEGWICWRSRLLYSLRVELLIDGISRGVCVADLYRADVQQAGFGDGKCGFRFDIARSAVVRDFATTRLRLLDTALVLLPDESTKISHPAG